jgi:hypothetical protein
MEDLGYPKTFLSLNITRDKNGCISISQSGYIDRMLARFKMSNAISVSIPLMPALLNATPLDKRADIKLYHEIIGSLNHIAIFSWPDISNVVSQLSYFLQDLTKTHMIAARHVHTSLSQKYSQSLYYLWEFQGTSYSWIRRCQLGRG